LPRRNDREADPRKRKRAEDSQEERSKAFHVRLNSADWTPPLLGLRKKEVTPFISDLRMSRLPRG
jgi:hypothetical protein